jgi:hypothetical protein
MGGDTIEVGDRVVNLQMPGIFRVIARHGRLIDIEGPQGVRMTVRPEAVRKLADAEAG